MRHRGVGAPIKVSLFGRHHGPGRTADVERRKGLGLGEANIALLRQFQTGAEGGGPGGIQTKLAGEWVIRVCGRGYLRRVWRI